MRETSPNVNHEDCYFSSSGFQSVERRTIILAHVDASKVAIAAAFKTASFCAWVSLKCSDSVRLVSIALRRLSTMSQHFPRFRRKKSTRPESFVVDISTRIAHIRDIRLSEHRRASMRTTLTTQCRCGTTATIRETTLARAAVEAERGGWDLRTTCGMLVAGDRWDARAHGRCPSCVAGGREVAA